MDSGNELAARPGFELPATWDPGRDVLVWVGPPSPAMPRGVRVFRVPASTMEAGSDESSAGVQLVRSAPELFRAVLALPGVMPKHALVHRARETPPELAHTLAQSLKNGLRCRAMARKTVTDSGTTWLTQGLANLPALCANPSIDTLRGAFAGKPAVLVSPGPSLSRNLAELGALSQRAVILTGTHALAALLGTGVAPHFVLCADPGDLGRHWAGLDLARVGAFVIGATCRAETFAAPVRRRFAFASNGETDAWLFEPLGAVPGLATGGSVSCSMLSFALFLGCDPITLVGQDLSFTERFYAAESLDGDAAVVPEGAREFRLLKPAGATGIGVPLADGRLQFTPAQRILEVPGWSGGLVRTTPQLKAFLDWFEAVVPALKGATRLVNCTEGGAHITGMEHLSLRETSADWQPVEVEAVLERACTDLDRAARRAKLAAWAQRTLRALEECVTLARRCRALAKGGDAAAL
ncbi:MAG: DUF115 domain-containing protein, partial [Planctomycetes bacterium]|nr:DUF115 domain-containing protein [Planctomycetota bacterium]